jgi:hypothetical protein
MSAITNPSPLALPPGYLAAASRSMEPDAAIRAKENTTAKEEKKTKNRGASARVPLLIDLSLLISRLVVVTVAALVITVSLLSGATIRDAAARGAVALAGIGLLAFILNWLLARSALDAAVIDLREEYERLHAEAQARAKAVKAESTVELSA